MSVRRDDIQALIDASRDEAARRVRSVSDPALPNDTVKIAIRRAASRLGWNFNRTQDIWRKEARRIDAHEMDQLRRWSAAHPHTLLAQESSEPQESGGKLKRRERN